MMPIDDSDPPNSDDFRKCLDAVLNDARRSGRPYVQLCLASPPKCACLNDARRSGRPYVDVRAKELHKMVGGYPNKGNHRMPVCCGVMKKKDAEGRQDTVKPTERVRGDSMHTLQSGLVQSIPPYAQAAAPPPVGVWVTSGPARGRRVWWSEPRRTSHCFCNAVLYDTSLVLIRRCCACGDGRCFFQAPLDPLIYLFI